MVQARKNPRRLHRRRPFRASVGGEIPLPYDGKDGLTSSPPSGFEALMVSDPQPAAIDGQCVSHQAKKSSPTALQQPQGREGAPIVPSGARTYGAPAPLSLDQRTNFDGGGCHRNFRTRFKLIRYPDGHAEMVATRYRKPRSGSRKPVESVDDDGVVTTPPIKSKPPKKPWQVVNARDKSVNRARTGLRRAVQSGGLDTMLTLTFRRNQTDIQEAWRIATKFIRAMRDAQGDFSYVIVAERQKRGAWHFHLALRGWQNLKLIRDCWRRAGADGNIDVQPFKGPVQKMASYMSKYISKSFTADELDRRSHHRYRRSQDLSPQEFVQVVTLDAADARGAFKRLFEEAGLAGHAVVTHGTPDEFEYFVWGCTWVDPPG